MRYSVSRHTYVVLHTHLDWDLHRVRVRWHGSGGGGRWHRPAGGPVLVHRIFNPGPHHLPLQPLPWCDQECTSYLYCTESASLHQTKGARSPKCMQHAILSVNSWSAHDSASCRPRTRRTLCRMPWTSSSSRCVGGARWPHTLVAHCIRCSA
jgi:hypothetical protein